MPNRTFPETLSEVCEAEGCFNTAFCRVHDDVDLCEEHADEADSDSVDKEG